MYDFFPNYVLRPFYPPMHGVPGSSQRKGVRSSTGTAFYVDAGSGNDNNKGWDAEHPLATIQQAIDNASAGDWIIVNPGTYNEQVEVDKSLTIVGPNRFGAAVILPTAVNAVGMSIDADNVTIANLTIFGGDNSLVIEDGHIGIIATDCRFADADDVVEVIGSGNVVFERCAFYGGDNGLVFTEGAANCENIVVKDSVFLDLDVTGITDGSDQTTESLIVSDCVFEGSPTDFIVVTDAGSTGIITRCSFAHATNAAAVLDIAAGIMWVANMTEAGVSTARPA